MQATSGRTVISIPEMPSPAASCRENLIFTNMKPPDFMLQKWHKQGRCSYKRGGGGYVTMHRYPVPCDLCDQRVDRGQEGPGGGDGGGAGRSAPLLTIAAFNLSAPSVPKPVLMPRPRP